MKLLTRPIITATLGPRGDHPTNVFPKVSPIAIFTKRNYLALVPGHLNQWFWRDFDSKCGVFGRGHAAGYVLADFDFVSIGYKDGGASIIVILTGL